MHSAGNFKCKSSGEGNFAGGKFGFQSGCGIAKSLGAGEAIEFFGDNQVGLKRAEAAIAMGHGVGNELRNLTFTLTGRHVFMGFGAIILDVEVLDLWPKQGPGFINILADFEIIRRVECMAKGRAADGGDQVV